MKPIVTKTRPAIKQVIDLQLVVVEGEPTELLIRVRDKIYKVGDLTPVT